MLERLPEYIDPLHLADKRGVLTGQMSISGFARLKGMLHSDTGNVDVSLVFSREGKIAKIDGAIKSVLQLECQNCLNPIEWVIDCIIKLGIVSSLDEADRLPQEFEPLLVHGELKVLLNDIIEDELLLILPAFPKHQHNCFSSAINRLNNDFSIDQRSAVETPFSILAKLKNTGDL